ncbi:MAG: CD225/dispanin family protein [Thermoguttaceae bacterium]|nr:CD225/dispanin family protein [Thermoguttaceae bacterium]
MENEKKDEVVFCPKCGAMITGEYCFFCGSSREGDKTSGESPYETLGKGAWADNSSQQIWLINDYMANSVVVLCCFFNLVFGVMVISSSLACRAAKRDGNYALAVENSERAHRLFNIALAIWLIGASILVLAVIGGIMSGSFSGTEGAAQ